MGPRNRLTEGQLEGSEGESETYSFTQAPLDDRFQSDECAR
jgi:hypothetical protein